MYDIVRRYYHDVYLQKDEDQEVSPRELQELRAHLKMVLKLQGNNSILSDKAKDKFLREVCEFYCGTVSMY
jgi:hypothetical protein